MTARNLVSLVPQSVGELADFDGAAAVDINTEVGVSGKQKRDQGQQSHRVCSRSQGR